MRAAAGTNEAQQADSGNGSGDCHGRSRNHSHSHGHHGGGGGGKDKPGTPAAASNPWVISAGAAPRAASSSVGAHGSHRRHRPRHWSRRLFLGRLQLTSLVLQCISITIVKDEFCKEYNAVFDPTAWQTF